MARQIAGLVRRPPRDAAADGSTSHHLSAKCATVIQTGAPIKYGIVDGMNVRDSRVSNYPARWNGAAE